MRTPRLIAVVTLVAVGGLAAGCGGSGTNSPGEMSAPVAVSMSRTGGIAGVNQSIEIAPDGSWIYTDKRNSQSENGTLPADQRAELQRLVSDPGFAGELARAARSQSTCTDGFQYSVATTGEKMSYADCGRGIDAPLVEAAVTLVTNATPF